MLWDAAPPITIALDTKRKAPVEILRRLHDLAERSLEIQIALVEDAQQICRGRPTDVQPS